MLRRHATRGRQSKTLSPTGSDGDRDAASNQHGGGVGIDLKLPWRVHEFEVWEYRSASTKPVYHVYDRRGLIIAVFLDLQIARAVAEIVNVRSG
jgi:hypothetical protein